VSTSTETTKQGYRVSYLQDRVWAAQKGRSPLTASCTLEITGPLQTARLAEALETVARRHEILRTRFYCPPGVATPYQVIEERSGVHLAAFDCGTCDSLEACLERMPRTDPNDLERDGIVRVTHCAWKPDRHVLRIELPAIACDEPSLQNLVRELAAAYDAPERPGEVPLQNADIAKWLESLLDSEDAEEAARFWADPVHRAFENLSLWSERRDEDDVPFRVSRVSIDLDRKTLDELDALTLDPACEASTCLLIAWQALLRRLTGRQELTVGVAHEGRNSEELEDSLGLLARYLPVPALGDERSRCGQLMNRMEERLEDALEWEEYFHWSRDETGLPAYFPFVFGYKTLPEPIRGEALSWTMCASETVIDRFDLCLEGCRTAEGLRLDFCFDRGRYDAEAVEILAEQYRTLLRELVNRPRAPIGSLSIIGAREHQLQLGRFAGEETAEIDDCCVHEMFDARARNTPDRDALIRVDRDGTVTRWSYAALANASDRIATRLIERGVKQGDRIGLAGERCPETIAGLLGIAKAGAAYVPMSTQWPKERFAYIAKDAGMTAILSSDPIPDAPAPVLTSKELLAVDASETDTRALPKIDPQSLVYVIYTSGSTGRPKGVGISHRSMIAYVTGLEQRLELERGISMASPAGNVTDLGNTALFGALCGGRVLRLLDEDLILDAEGMAANLEAHPVDCMKIVPNHLKALLSASRPERLLPRKCLILGGDVLDVTLVAQIRRLAPSCRIVNHYGPTETTVGVLTHEVTAETPRGAVPIGRPFANTRVRVRESSGGARPLGMIGELAVSGPFLARGYWGAPSLTAQKFVPDPHARVAGSRLYLTGDQVRFLPDGNLEFQGRNDNQVKVRGHRIDLGEIEVTLRESPTLRDAVVTARRNRDTGENHLIAYVIPEAGARVESDALRAFLEDRLADHMVPGDFVVMDAFPLNSNGKVLRQSLPDPDARAARADFEAPRNETEAALVEIWKQVLGVDELGIHDNFFSLGGDSIMTIQIVARARRYDIVVTPKMIFDQQTPAKVAAHALTATRVEAPQGTITGEVPLLPIQRRFFEIVDVDRHHYNQSLLLEAKPDVDRAALAEAFAALIRHHDALRARFQNTENGPRQHIQPETEFELSFRDLSTVPAEDLASAIERIGDETQTGFDLSQGNLVRAVWIDLGPEHSARLLIVIHHLLVDGVSWRLLVEDLTSVYENLRAGQQADLPLKTSSLKQWAEHLSAYAGSEKIEAEKSFWMNTARHAGETLPRDAEPTDDPETRHVTITLEAEETETLLKKIPSTYGTEINDALLSTLAIAVSRWTGRAGLFVELEGHGREDLFEDIDLSRTVGWFTSRFPVYLALPERRDPGACIRSVKEQLRRIPKHGIGYGILRYLGEDAAVADVLAEARPEISFNYLGQVDRSLADEGPFRGARESSGRQTSPRLRRPNPLAISGIVSGGCLQLTLVYDSDSFTDQAIAGLSRDYLTELKALIAHCLDPSEVSYTVSDFPEVSLMQEELDDIVDQLSITEPRDNIEAISKVSPIQHGMLFHSEAAPGSGIYVVQFACDLIGELDVDLFKAAWDSVLDRFDIFRGLYLRIDSDEPLLVIRKRVDLPWHTEDLRDFPATEQEARFTRYRTEDRLEPFDFSAAPLMRMALFRTGDAHHRFLWCYHHVLSDGWSTPIVVSTAFSHYVAARAGKPASLPPAPAFRNFISWLNRQDRDAAKSFWRDYLKGFHEPIRMKVDPGVAKKVETKPSVHYFLTLPKSFNDAFQGLARSRHMTASLLAQAALGLLLAHHSGRRDIAFGCVVSGRPPELPDVENMVGPFVNSQPVRVAVDPDTPILPWLDGLFEAQIARDRHSHLPLVEIKQCSEITGSAPIFEYLFQYQNYPVGDDLAKDVETDLRVVEVEHYDYNNYPFTLIISARSDFTIQVMYNTGRIEERDIVRLADHYRILVEGLIARPEGRVSDLLALLDEADRAARQQKEQELKSRSRSRLKSIKRKVVTGGR